MLPLTPFPFPMASFPPPKEQVPLKRIYNQGNVDRLPEDPEELKDYCVALQAINAEITKEKDQLRKENEELRLEKQVSKLLISDEELFTMATERHCLQEWLDKMLGNNKDLDDLHAAEQELKKFREIVQKRLDLWKEQFSVYVSLEKELQEVEEIKAIPKSVPEIIAKLTSEIDRDFQNIFDQIEENLKKLTDRKDELIKERENLNAKLDEKERQLTLNEADLQASNLLAFRCGEVEEELNAARDQIEDLKEENARLERLEKEDKTKIVELDRLNHELGLLYITLENKCKLLEQSLEELKHTNARLQKSLKEVETDKIKELREEILRLESNYATASAGLKGEAYLRKEAEKRASLAERSAQENAELDRVRFQSETNMRCIAEKEIEALKIERNALRKLLKENENDETLRVHAFMIKFIQTLTPEKVAGLTASSVSVPAQFKIEYDKEFKRL